MSGAAEVFAYFLRLGATVFGGVGPQLSRMRRELVDEKKWITPEEFERGVALAYLCPGPVGTQAGVYMGWRRAGAAGATAALIGFLLVPFCLVVALAVAHAHFGSGGWFGRLVEGMRCAVVPVIALSAFRLYKSLPGTPERAISVAAFVWCVLRPTDATLAVFGLGLLLAVMTGRLSARGAAAASIPAVFLVGLQAGAFVYGTGQAILPIVREAVVIRRAWLTNAQFTDAISAGLVTPGPIVLALAYVGYAASGSVLGALAATIGAFAPGWALVLLIGPKMESLERNPKAKAFSRGATAAAIGGVAAAALALSFASLGSTKTALLGAASLAAILYGAPDAAVIAACGLVALALF